MRRALLVVLTCGMMVAPKAKADFYSGNRLLEICQSREASFREGMCWGFVIGVADAMSGRDAAVGGWRACLPTPVTVAQVTDIAKRYLQRYPERRHYPAANLVAAALAEAFPCG